VEDYRGFKTQAGPRYAVLKAYNVPAVKMLPKQVSTSTLESLSHNCLRGVAKTGDLRESFWVQLLQVNPRRWTAGKGLLCLTLSYPGLTQSQMLSWLIDIYGVEPCGLIFSPPLSATGEFLRTLTFLRKVCSFNR